MISKVYLNGFNGFNREHELSTFTLFTGTKGAGKSTVWQAINFVLQSIPAANVQGEFDAHYDRSTATGSISVSLQIGRDVLTRTLKQSLKLEDKKITQMFCVNAKQLSRQEEITYLNKLGIVIPSITGFLSLSDQRQIAYLFQHFSQGIDIEKLTTEIENTRKKELDLEQRIRNKDGSLVELQTTLDSFPVPSSETLAMLDKEIQEKKETVKILGLQLKAVQDKIAEEERQRQEKIREVERIKREHEVIAQAKEEERQKIAQEQINMSFPFEEPPEELMPITLVFDESVKPCQKCIESIQEIIAIADKPVVCYQCQTPQMSAPGLLNLKNLRNNIKEKMLCPQ